MKFIIRRTLLIGVIVSAYYLGMLNAQIGNASSSSQRYPSSCQKYAGLNCPPYWGKQPPAWCYEDQICWIGSGEDGRSDRAALKDYWRQLHRLAR